MPQVIKMPIRPIVLSIAAAAGTLSAIFLWSSHDAPAMKTLQSFNESEKCMPLIQETVDQVALFHLTCSRAAHANEARPVYLTEKFSMPEGMIARRAKFWRRVFGLWSTDEFVLHSSVYPEVVLEFGTPSHDEEATRKETRKIRKVMNARRRAYRQVLRKMAQQPESQWTAEMQRIAGLMSHIEDPKKFQVAARSLRIQRGQREYFQKGVTTSKRYLSHIKKHFREEGVPEELAYIAFIESSFNLNARSKVGASGIYQIMPFTGKSLMRITRNIDERSDPIKAGHAAARIFKSNYKMTGTWPLAITSYNHGPYSIKKAIKRLGTTDMETIIRKYRRKSFGFASKNFYPEFLGILSVIQNDVPNMNIPDAEPIEFRSVTLERPRRVRWVRNQHLVSNSDITALNPDLNPRAVRRNMRLPRGYTIKLPISKPTADIKTLTGSDE